MRACLGRFPRMLDTACMPDDILIVEDDPELRALLARGLGSAGFGVRAMACARDALAAVERASPRALVIDIGLPDADGRDLCQALRAQGIQAPVLFLTARDALVDRLSGFESGGDDYVTKPFAVAEVAARLRALLKRAPEGAAAASGVAGALELDPATHEVRAGDRVAPLTPTEFRILGALAGARSGGGGGGGGGSGGGGETVPRRALIRAAWPAGAVVHDNTLDVYVARLRRKLRELPGAPAIVTAHGVGYRLK